MRALKSLSYNLLKESYKEAIKLNISVDFIKVLEQGKEKRGL